MSKIDFYEEIKHKFTISDLELMLEWYRISHHFMGFKACPHSIKLCHNLKRKIINYKNNDIKNQMLQKQQKVDRIAKKTFREIVKEYPKGVVRK